MRAAFFLLLAGVALAADDGWSNLKQITHDRDYKVVFRDGHCSSGRIASVAEQQFVLADVTVKRSDVLRISDAPSIKARDTVFSGRSSWADVKGAEPKSSEYLHIVISSGQERKWKPVISDDSITFEGKSVAKSDVRSVSYVRYKPLTETEEYFNRESADLFAPRLWFGALMLGKINVLLYDSSRPEDNSPIVCR